MTYCVALRLNRGLVFAADTRTSAGNDNVTVFRKLHYWRKMGERVVVTSATRSTCGARSASSRRTEYFRKLSSAWSEALRSAVAKMEEFKV